MYKFAIHKLLIALVMTVGVAACGSGGDGGGFNGGGPFVGPAPSGSIPASALANVDGLVAFLNMLIDTDTNDTGEPILLGDANLPTDDTI